MTDSSSEASTAELISRLSEQSTRLIRDEMALAQAELTQKLKRVGIGSGMFGAAGLTASFGLATLVTTAILALALVLDAWLAALIVTVVLFAVAGVLALVGKKQVAQGVPPAPERTIASVKQDVQTLKESAHHDR
jgi:Flp pilus assembly protein TadB